MGFYKKTYKNGLIDALVIIDMNFQEHQKLDDLKNRLLDFIKELKFVVKKAGGSNEVYCNI